MEIITELIDILCAGVLPPQLVDADGRPPLGQDLFKVSAVPSACCSWENFWVYLNSGMGSACSSWKVL